MEQYSRRDCIEIQGVPEASREDTISSRSVVQTVGNAIGFKVENHMIDPRYKLKKSESRPSQIRKIIVKFFRRTVKEEFLRKKTIKRKLRRSDLT